MCLHVHMHFIPTNAEADMAFSWQCRHLMAAPWMHTRFYPYSVFPKGQIFEPCPRDAGAKPVNCGFSQLRLDKPRLCCWFITCSSEVREWKTNIYTLQVHRMAFKKLVLLLFCVMRRKYSPGRQRHGEQVWVSSLIRVGKSPEGFDIPFTHPFADYLLCFVSSADNKGGITSSCGCMYLLYFPLPHVTLLAASRCDITVLGWQTC